MKEQIMKNKKGVLTRDLVIAGLLFTGIVALFVLAIAGVADNYDNTEIINENFANNYDKLSEIANDVNLTRGASQSSEGLSFIGTFDVIFSSTFTVIKMVFATLDLIGDMAANFVSDYTFLDASVIKILFIMALAILTTVLVFVWISSVSRSNKL